MADNDKLSRGTLIGFIGGLIGVALTASTGNEQIILGAFVVGCILGVVLGTVESDWK
jgi:drug/metabolite transporter (DMT)-like permease